MVNKLKRTDVDNSDRLSWVNFIPALLWMGVIYYSSSQTGDEVGRLLPLVQSIFPFITDFNFMHIVTYFILALLIDFAFGQRASKLSYKIIIVSLCLVYGISDEVHQMFVGGRTPDMIDIRNDGIGAILWVLLASINKIRKWWNKLPRK